LASERLKSVEPEIVGFKPEISWPPFLIIIDVRQKIWKTNLKVNLDNKWYINQVIKTLWQLLVTLIDF
jgi:hypothetical protein